MTELLREGIGGRKFKATLIVYVGSLLALAPIAALIGLVWNYQKLLFITPVLVVLLVGIEYVLSGFAPDLVGSESFFELPASAERRPAQSGRLFVRLTRVALYPVSASVFLAGSFFHTSGDTIFKLSLGALLPFILVMSVFLGLVTLIEGLVVGLTRSRPKRDSLSIEHEKTKQRWH